MACVEVRTDDIPMPGPPSPGVERRALDWIERIRARGVPPEVNPLVVLLCAQMAHDDAHPAESILRRLLVQGRLTHHNWMDERDELFSFAIEPPMALTPEEAEYLRSL
jgi:hypothetical protein